jgi:hypothetical protein
MTAESRAGLAAEIEATVRATPGVRSVYRSGSLISGLLRVGAEALGVRSDDEPIVSVVLVEGGVAVEASIGVAEGARSGDTLHAVHAAVDALLDEKGVRRRSLTLTVVHVQSTDAA